MQKDALFVLNLITECAMLGIATNKSGCSAELVKNHKEEEIQQMEKKLTRIVSCQDEQI